MTADRWTKIEDVYHRARERHGEERARFLDAACAADVTMRGQVEALLRADATGNSLFDHPAITLMPEWRARIDEPGVSGHHLGVYEILELIGSGGMGQVYRARDMRLHRVAALKFLPNRLAADHDRLSRFRREAQALAALNHANIAQVYGLEESGSTYAIAMELVEGDTLAQRLERGPLSVVDALRIAKDIAEALEAAHEKGIVHRDLKPANVKVTPQGQVKVLDFGLAQVARASDDDPNPGSVVLAKEATADGVILGTPPYMSPEQATGMPTDHRTDVFSFGCVLYEMLTGRRAFDGDTPSAALASAVTSDPDLRQLPRRINSRIDELIRRCLEKNRRSRWQAMGDVRIEIETIQQDPQGLFTSDGDVKPRPLRKRALPLLTAVAGAALILTAVVIRPTPVAPDSITRFTIDLPSGLRLNQGGRHVIAVSADGSRIAFVANDQLHIREMPDTTVHPVSVKVFGLNTPVFSPDGRWVAFFADGKLQKVAVTAGTPLVVCDSPDPFGASWAPDNTILIGAGPNGIQRVSSTGGLETIVTVDAGKVAHGPQLLPDGEHVLFTVATDDVGSERWDRAEIVVQSLKSGERKVVVHNGSDARFDSSTGSLLYAEGSALRAVAFDPQKLQIVGEPESIVEGVRRAALDGVTGAAQFAVSTTGTLAYVAGDIPPTSRALAQIDMKGTTTVLDILPGQNFTPRFSADGRHIAWRGGDGNIWVFDRTGITAKRKLTLDGKNAAPVWTRDGHIVFQSTRNGERGLFRQRGDGSAPPERLLKTDPPFIDTPTSVSPDGKILLFLKTIDPSHSKPASVGQPEGVWMLSLEGNRAPHVVIERRKGASPYEAAAFSPDGRWIVYQTWPFRGMYVEPFPPTGARYDIATDVSWAPIWSPDGNRLLYLSGPNRRSVYAVEVLRKEPSLEVAAPRLLFSIDKPLNTFGDGGRIADISPDGKYIVAIQGSVAAQGENASTIDVVLNWAADRQSRRTRRALTAFPPGL